MRNVAMQKKQRGVALAVSMIFLLVVTIISVVAASNSRQGLAMTANLQDSYDSFQAAEAGLVAAWASVDTPGDVFGLTTTLDVYDGMDDATSPIGHVSGGNDAMEVNVFLTASATGCPIPKNGKVWGDGAFLCDYYRIESEHQVDRKARTKVNQGVVKMYKARN